MLQRFTLCTLSLLMLLIAPLSIVQAADPITAHVILPPAVSLDPVSLGRFDASGRTIAENLFVGLTRYNPATNQIEHGLAQDWTVSDDKLTWTFKLRNDVKWVSYNASTGEVQAVRPVVAADFVYGIRRACDPLPPNPIAHTIFVVAGCRNIATANPASIDDAFVARELHVQAIDDQTLEIKLALTVPNFDVLVSQPEFRPVAHEAVEKGIAWTYPDSIITNGPWALADGRPDQPSMTLVRNPMWPDKPAGNVERVAISFSTDNISQQVTSGAADFAVLDTPTAVGLKQSKPNVVKSAPGQSVTVLGFSAERPIVQKASFRQALSEAIDRASLIQSVLPDVALPISRLTPPGAIGGPTTMPTDSGYAPDAAKAALYAGAGYNGCVLNARLQLLVDDQPQSEALANALSAQWKDVLGCSSFQFIVDNESATTVQNVAHGAVNTADPKAQPRPEMWIYSWSPDYPDANAWTGDAIHCQYGFMRTGVPCGTGDMLVNQAFLELDNVKRADLYNQAETAWFGPQGTFPVIPLYVSLNYVAQQPWLKGAAVNGPQRFDLWTLSQHS